MECDFVSREEVPKLEKFMREPPTEEEEKKHKEIKQTLSEGQRMAADALKHSIKLKGNYQNFMINCPLLFVSLMNRHVKK